MNIPKCLTLSSSSYIPKKDHCVYFKVIFLLDRGARVLVCAQLSTVKWVQCKAKLSQIHTIFARAQSWLCKQGALHVCIVPTNPDSLKLCRHSCFHFSCHPCSVAWQFTNVFKYNFSLPSFLQNCNFGNCLSKWIFFFLFPLYWDHFNRVEENAT